MELCALAEKGQVNHAAKPRREAHDLYDRLNNSVEQEYPFSTDQEKREDIARALVRDFAEEQAYTIALAVARSKCTLSVLYSV